MKKNNSFLNIIILIVLLLSCNKSQNITSQTFDNKINLKLDSIKIPPILLRENKIIVTDEFLISMSVYQDTIFRVFKLPKIRYIGKFGIKGKGPREIIYPSIAGFIALKNEDLQVSGLKKIRIIEFSNKHLVTPNNIIIKKEISIPGSLLPFNNGFILNDSIICGVNRLVSEKEITYFNTKSNMIGSFIDYPNIYPQAPKDALWHLYTKHIAFSITNQKIAMLYDNYPLLRIYDVSSKKIKDYYIETDFKQKPVVFTSKSVKNIFDLYSYYSNIYVTDNYIYGLYQVSKTVHKNKNEFVSIPLTQKQIHIFSWDGKIVKKIKLKSWMNVFSVSPDDKYIYFIHPDKENYIYKATL